MNESEFSEMLEKLYQNGGKCESLSIPGLGTMNWSAMDEEEKAFVRGWLACRKYLGEMTNDEAGDDGIL